MEPVAYGHRETTMAYVKGRVVQWYDPIQRRRKTKTYATEVQAAAEAELREKERQAIRSGLIDAKLVEETEKRRVRVEPLVERYDRRIQKKGGRNKGRLATIKTLRRVLKACDIYEVADFNHERIERYLEVLKLDENLSHRTHNEYLSTVRSFCKWLVERDHIDKNPTFGIDLLDPRKDKRRPSRPLSVEEMDCLIAAAGPRRLQYLFRFRTGLRATECRRLRGRDIDLDGQTLHLREEVTKNGEAAMLPLTNDLCNELRQMRFRGLDDPVFPSMPKCNTWQRDMECARKAWISEATSAKAREDRQRSDFLIYQTSAGVAEPKCVRQTLDSHMIRAGCDLTIIQLMLRHAPSGGLKLTLGVYGDADALLDRKRDAIRQLESWYQEQREPAKRSFKQEVG